MYVHKYRYARFFLGVHKCSAMVALQEDVECIDI